MKDLLTSLPDLWPDIAAGASLLSFLITVVALLERRHKNRQLDSAFFGFREIHLTLDRYLARDEQRELIPVEEVNTLLSGCKAVAATGMHAIQPYPFGELTRFRRTLAIYNWLLAVKKGLKRLWRAT